MSEHTAPRRGEDPHRAGDALQKIADDILATIDRDVAARAAWWDSYRRGLDFLGFKLDSSNG